MSSSRDYSVSAEEIINPEPLNLNMVRTALGLTIEELAAISGRSPRSAARWLAEESAEPVSGDAARALRRLAHLEFLLVDVIGHERGKEWLRTPNPGFRGEAPIDLATSGRLERVISILEVLADGAPL